MTSYSAIAFSGSLRANSANTGLARMAVRLSPSELAMSYFDIAALPFYNADLEADVPEPVRVLREAASRVDALVVAMPEYNFLPSPAAKNAIDWLSRPMGASALKGRFVAMLTSAGKVGGVKVQATVGPILELLGATVVTDAPVNVALGMDRISADGTTTDPEIERLVSAKLEALVVALRARSNG